MRIKHLLLSAAAGCIAISAHAQQNVGFRTANVNSPVVNADKTVTFNIVAPKAKAVSVAGDWEANGGKGTLTKGKNGVWTYTTPVLPSEMYTYRFTIDGVTTIDPLNSFTRRDVGNVFSMFFVDGGNADYYQVRDVAHGSIQTLWMPQQGLENTYRRMNVYLPPHYNESDATYPVLYLLHGSGGDETAWLDLGFVNRVMDNLIAEGKAQPMIVVLPNGNVSVDAAAGETEANLSYMPVLTKFQKDYKNSRFEAAFPQIVSFVDGKFRTKATKSGRALAGLSMGGFNTLFISAAFPNLFDYVGLFSAGLDYKGLDMTNPIYSDLKGKLKAQKEAGYKLYWIGDGDEDPWLLGVKDHMKLMDSVGMTYTFYPATRGHIWANWRKFLLEFAPKLFK